ncbi:MAG: PHP domain-containing protein [Lachnospiraceae bacterium]|nr:PHP domain-containing protein [Lachnospiraceae bacterium]
MINISDFKYKYETHLHTKEASACARNEAKDMAKAAKEAGYAGIFVTDHAWGGNTSVDKSLPWKEWVSKFAKGYENAKEWADENDFTVFYGYEAGFNATEFLIYGLTPEWMAEHEELHDASIEEQLKIVHSGGGIVVHAHPFREEFYIPKIRLFPEFVDGVEGVNATHSSHLSTSHNDHNFDIRAIEYAKEHGFFMTAGSDVHSTSMLGGGIMTREKLNSPQDFINLLKSDEMYLLTDGDRIYDRYANLLIDT